MTSKTERLCHGCNFPVRRGVLPIIWPGTARTAVYCSVKCAENAGVQFHPRHREQLIAGEGSGTS